MVKNQRKVFIFSAPSGAGKTTIVRAMMKQFDIFAFSVSATTRSPRPNEQDGVDYHFFSQTDFFQKTQEGVFLEWEEVYPGRYYGTLLSEVNRIIDQGKCPIFDVDVKGGCSIKEYYKENAVAIFIKPPSVETLRQRLIGRKSESIEEIDRRMKRVAEELTFAKRFDYVVVNDVLETALEEVANIIRKESQR